MPRKPDYSHDSLHRSRDETVMAMKVRWPRTVENGAARHTHDTSFVQIASDMR